MLEKTWSTFEAHFARVFKETRRLYRTSKTKGYAANVISARDNTTLFTNMQQDNTIVLANISTATQSERILVALLTKMIAKLSSEVSTLTAKLATAQSENTCLKRSGHSSAPADHGH